MTKKGKHVRKRKAAAEEKKAAADARKTALAAAADAVKDEPAEKKEKKPEKDYRRLDALAWGMGVGILLGALIGTFTGRSNLFMPLGLLAGSCVGLLMARRVAKEESENAAAEDASPAEEETEVREDEEPPADGEA
jgi:F0F1-type ATP synthase assembly protein I